MRPARSAALSLRFAGASSSALLLRYSTASSASQRSVGKDRQQRQQQQHSALRGSGALEERGVAAAGAGERLSALRHAAESRPTNVLVLASDESQASFNVVKKLSASAAAVASPLVVGALTYAAPPGLAVVGAVASVASVGVMGWGALAMTGVWQKLKEVRALKEHHVVFQLDLEQHGSGEESLVYYAVRPNAWRGIAPDDVVTCRIPLNKLEVSSYGRVSKRMSRAVINGNELLLPHSLRVYDSERLVALLRRRKNTASGLSFDSLSGQALVLVDAKQPWVKLPQEQCIVRVKGLGDLVYFPKQKPTLLLDSVARSPNILEEPSMAYLPGHQARLVKRYSDEGKDLSKGSGMQAMQGLQVKVKEGYVFANMSNKELIEQLPGTLKPAFQHTKKQGKDKVERFSALHDVISERYPGQFGEESVHN